jgi:aspartate kinase
MSIIVQKYGGTSIGSIERMRHVADLINAERKAGHQVIVVASAMAGVTNQLVKSAMQFNNAAGTSAYDFVISTGENVSCGMLALALAEKGIHAVPLAGWQVPIQTNNLHGRARIANIETAGIQTLLDNNVIPIITGFQGLGSDQTITTLGRGGSDTSAVAIAAALKAECCDIYTDIDGIYTADPRVVPDAHFIETIPSTTAFLMATLGTKIIHPRAVEYAMKFNMPLRILSSFGSEKFTTVDHEANPSNVVGIAHLNDVIMLDIPIVESQTVKMILEDLDHLDIPIDMINYSDKRLQLCAESLDSSIILETLSFYADPIVSQRYSKISIVGVTVKGYLDSSLHALQQKSILVNHAYTEDDRISILVPIDQMELAVNTLHMLFF